MQRKMHVLQLGPYPPPRGGVQTNMLAIESELIAAGHNSSIISITKADRIGDEENVFHPRNPFALFRLILALNYDVLHLHIGGNLSPRIILLILVCGIFSRGQSVLTFHSGGYSESAEGRNASYWTLRGFAFRRYDKIIVVNRSMVKMFEDFGVKSGKVDLIYPFAIKISDRAIEIPKKFCEFLDGRPRVMITVGLLETDYDLSQQINVLERVLREYPKTGLVIIGSGSLERELRGLIDSKPYSEHILLAGDTERDVVLQLIEKSDLMLRTTIFDGDAISVRESLFLGTPVIATDNGMRPEGIRLVPVGDLDALEHAIRDEFRNVRKPKRSDEDGMENIRAVIGVYEQLTAGYAVPMGDR